MSDARKLLFLRNHNRYRNQLALGKVPGYEPAARMPILRWNKELARLAELNVHQCEMKHDECHNTDKLRWSGQNLMVMSTPEPNNKHVINNATFGWFDEYKFATMDHIKAYRSSDVLDKNNKPEMIGHFTAMIQDRSDQVGCAILRQTDTTNDLRLTYFVACNYGFTNVMEDKGKSPSPDQLLVLMKKFQFTPQDRPAPSARQAVISTTKDFALQLKALLLIPVKKFNWTFVHF